VALKRTLTGVGPEMTIELADDPNVFPPALIELRVRLDQWVKGDEVVLRWDGARIETPEVRYCMNADPLRIGDVSTAVWLCAPLAPAQTGPGPHTVEIVLEHRHPQVVCDIVVTDVEVVVKY
ncbi:MAG: hypothetical protein FJY97_17240, partial [candidate division Zixibacteria bacterium]|nr:hypothetical protein [candidate division Zixibacteria bacterium]